MQLIPLFRKVHLSEGGTGSPPPKRLVQMQHRDVRKVGHSCDFFQDPESLNRPAFVNEVKHDAQYVVWPQNEPGSVGRVRFETLLFNLSHFVSAQSELVQLVLHLHMTTCAVASL